MLPEPKSLKDLQKTFWQLITAKEPVAKAMQKIARENPLAGKPETWILSENPEDAIRRLDIYANMYFFRLLDILRDDYPTVQSVLGEARFHNLMTDYLEVHPSQRPTVRHLGARLPSFIEEHQAISDAFPFLADLARFEWAQSELIDAEDSAPISLNDLRHFSQEEWQEYRFMPIFAHRSLHLSFPVHEIVRQDHQADRRLEIDPRKTHLLLWRRGFKVHHLQLNAEENDLFNLTKQNMPLAAICEVMAAHDKHEEDIAQRIFRSLSHWVSLGVFQASS